MTELIESKRHLDARPADSVRREPAATAKGTDSGPGELSRRAPLAFSQLAHWHLYRLAERPAIRQIASATRLRGRLDLEALQESIRVIVRRHDALRMRVVDLEGAPIQELDES